MQQLEYQFSSSFREIIRSAIHFTILFRPQPSAILLPSIMGFWLREKYQNKKDICGKFRCSYNKNKRRAVRLNCDSEIFLLHFFLKSVKSSNCKVCLAQFSRCVFISTFAITSCRSTISFNSRERRTFFNCVHQTSNCQLSVYVYIAYVLAHLNYFLLIYASPT